MSTTTAIDKSTIIRRLKVNVAEMVHLRSKADLLESYVFADTYLWITAAVADGTAQGVCHASKILADTLKTYTWNTFEKWYIRGKFMAEKNLRSDKVDRRSVSDLVSYQHKIPKATMFKLVDMMKNGRPHKEVRSHLRKLVPGTDIAKKAISRVNGMRKLGAIEAEQQLQLEMKVTKSLAKKVYGIAVHVVLEDKDGNVLRTTREPHEIPEVKIAKKRKKGRERSRLQIATETPEEREARLKKMRNFRKQRVAAETPEETEARRKKAVINHHANRATEIPKKREARLKKGRERARRCEANETPEKREARLKKMRERARDRIAAETPEEKEARLKKGREYARQIVEEKRNS